MRPPLQNPRALQPGQAIGVCAPSGPVADATLDLGIRRLEEAGHPVRPSAQLRERRGYLAGDDEARAAGLLELLRDPDVGLILAARGGYGLARVLGRLDPCEFRSARKLIAGYSDTTSLLCWLRECAGLTSLHGPMLEREDASDVARARLLALARGEPPADGALVGTGCVGGQVEAPLVGGNLATLVSSLGTPWEIDLDAAILFVEEVGEQPYRIDRMLVQLREAGKLASLAGAALGALVGCESERYPECSAREAACELLADAVSGPVVADLPIGHVADNRAVGFGVRARLDGGAGTLDLLEGVVELA